MDCKYIAIIDGKTYTYVNASQVFILEDAISIGVEEEILTAFVNKVFDLYLSDSNDTPLDKLINTCYTAKNTTTFIHKSLRQSFMRLLEKGLMLTDMESTFQTLRIYSEEKHFAVNVVQGLLPIRERQRQVVFLGITNATMLLVKEIAKLKCIKKTF